MTRYSFELKLKVVQDYDNGVGGCDYLANKYHVTNEVIVRRWVKAYKELGAVGIQRKRQNTVYSTQFKLNAVNLYLTSEKSYRELAHELGADNTSYIDLNCEKEDARNFLPALIILDYFKINEVTLLGNNLKKMHFLMENGVNISGIVNLIYNGNNRTTKKYILLKGRKPEYFALQKG